MVFYNKGLQGGKKPLPCVACDQKAAILRGRFGQQCTGIVILAYDSVVELQ